MLTVRVTVLACVAVVILVGTPALGQYGVLADFNDIAVGPQYNILGGHLIEGSTLYAIVRGIESDITPEWESQINKVENFDGVPTTTVLVTDAQWKAFIGGDEFSTILPGNRMAVIGDHLQFLDSAADGIYRVHKDTGALTEYVSTNGVKAITGLATADLIDAVALTADGAMTFYDQSSDHIFIVADSNGLPEISIFVSAEDITALYEGATPVNLVAGGMTFDCAGNLYWTLSQTGSTGAVGGSIYKRDAADGSLSLVLAQIDIQLATLEFGNVGFNDIFAAPDGNIYFFDRNSDSILYFHPDDPVNSLAVYLSRAELISGPAHTEYVGSFSARGGLLIWNHFVKASRDLYFKALADRPGDFDDDGDIDDDDYAVFADCLSGPGALPAPTIVGVTVDACLAAFDTDCDADIDLLDFASLQFVAAQ